MEQYSVKILSLDAYRDSDCQIRISVPTWFLDLISDAESCTALSTAIRRMLYSDEDELCKRKSIYLATIRKKVIEHDS
jgi:hypothetical protein